MIVLTLSLNNFDSVTTEQNDNSIKLIHRIPESREFIEDVFVLLKTWAIGINLLDKFGELQKIPCEIHAQLVILINLVHGKRGMDFILP